MHHAADHRQENEKQPAHPAHPAKPLKSLAESWAESGVHHAHENKGLGLQVDSNVDSRTSDLACKRLTSKDFQTSGTHLDTVEVTDSSSVRPTTQFRRRRFAPLRPIPACFVNRAKSPLWYSKWQHTPVKRGMRRFAAAIAESLLAVFRAKSRSLGSIPNSGPAGNAKREPATAIPRKRGSLRTPWVACQ